MNIAISVKNPGDKTSKATNRVLEPNGIVWAVHDVDGLRCAESGSRDAFRSLLPLDAGTWARGRGWVLWKALIIAAGLTTSNAFEASRPWRIIEAVLDDHRRANA